MADLSHPWGLYASQQAKLAKRSFADDTAWGIEESLNRLVQPDTQAIVTLRLVRRVADSAARRNRYGRALILKFSTAAAPESTDPISQLEARSDLTALQRRLNPADFGLLYAVGDGAARDELAIRLELSAVALRARISRTRAVARRLFAA